MPGKTYVNGERKFVLLEEEEKLLSQLMGELKFSNVDFLITKMVIYNWPKADKIDEKDEMDNGVEETDENEEKKLEDSASYLNRLSKWKQCILYDDFCFRFAISSCYNNKGKENLKYCKSLTNVIRKHDKSFNIESLYNNGNATLSNKRRAYYLARYMEHYCEIKNSFVIENFNKMIVKDKHYQLLQVSYENTILSKKAKRMRRKKNNKINGNLLRPNRDMGVIESDMNSFLSSLGVAQNVQQSEKIDKENTQSDGNVIGISINNNDDNSVTTCSEISVTNTFAPTDDTISNENIFIS